MRSSLFIDVRSLHTLAPIMPSRIVIHFSMTADDADLNKFIESARERCDRLSFSSPGSLLSLLVTLNSRLARTSEESEMVVSVPAGQTMSGEYDVSI